MSQGTLGTLLCLLSDLVTKKALSERGFWQNWDETSESLVRGRCRSNFREHVGCVPPSQSHSSESIWNIPLTSAGWISSYLVWWGLLEICSFYELSCKGEVSVTLQWGGSPHPKASHWSLRLHSCRLGFCSRGWDSRWGEQASWSWGEVYLGAGYLPFPRLLMLGKACASQEKWLLQYRVVGRWLSSGSHLSFHHFFLPIPPTPESPHATAVCTALPPPKPEWVATNKNPVHCFFYVIF